MEEPHEKIETQTLPLLIMINWIHHINIRGIQILLFIMVISQISCNQNPPFNEEYISDGFDFPVEKPIAKGYYDAQPFGKNNHLGSDWNGIGGGDTDLGDAIYATANGYVNFVGDLRGGWGKVIRITHMLQNGKNMNPFMPIVIRL